MDAFSEKLTSYFLRKDWIEVDQVPWCKYMVKHRALDVISLLWLIPVGCLVSPWYVSIAFVLSYRFLRSRTGGYHAKTPHFPRSEDAVAPLHIGSFFYFGCCFISRK